MRVVRSLEGLPARLPRVVLTIGNFDGVHRGHQKILERVVREARARRGTAVVMTFDPHPPKLLAPAQAPRLLTTLPQKLELLAARGVDLVLVLPFTRALSRLSPRDFIREIVCRRLGAESLCIGPTFRFGHQQAGDVAVLKALAREFRFHAKLVAPVRVRGQIVSSTLSRRLVQKGAVARARRLLGRPFALTGKVEPGAGRGRQLGFPTLNLAPEQECLPARGVYITETLLGTTAYASATNVGLRPTFGGRRLTVEAHLLGFSRKASGRRIEVRFLERLRAEKKFPSPEALRRQIQRDLAHTRRFFARRRSPHAG